MNIIIKKFKEVLFSVLPITLIVLLLNFTIIPLETHLILRFLIGAIFIIFGLSIFLLGVDTGVTPIGTLMGSSLAKNSKVLVLVFSGLILGFFITIAEPDLQILASQVSTVTSGSITKLSILVVVSIGIAIMLSIGLLRIIYNKSLKKMLTAIYLIIFVLSLFTSSEFLAISFDASGATTGAMTVPFILALALGVSSIKKDGISSEEDSFGLVAVASTGAILSVIIMSLISKSDKIVGDLSTSTVSSTSIINPFIEKLPTMISEVFFTLLPLLLLFFIFNKISFKLSKKEFSKILRGILYSFIGLILFLTGVNAGFIEIGTVVGHSIASLHSSWILVIVGFILGLVVILAEPAVHVLTDQIEIVTHGYIKKKAVIFTLSIGVAFAVALSMLRIVVPGIQLWHFLLPGYAISIIMSYFVPKLFVGIAFDSGGVASGPMAATFILAFAQGAAEAIEGANVLIDGFGVIAMVALTPLIALQILGLIFQHKAKKEGIKINAK
ncbi:DUF1538 domain-containing protein [Clostridium sp. CM028]|uniref:DUF1538 domain-containing protein n=1 Tax=unclassified Clostridium TaxID=2614128 RepID=UPI001C0D3606|nr:MULTISPECIES: DUF1538 domain-containing protein [unclassified Clostridium]MBU3092066.1 DUF1538 domain-containing protein [Clostridium sp. CF011]MBW9145493.1 DUF1538 domain-containing protein [Clostridium sp. CM027]MBW9149004.1 DUF1538 domain-containing protein [Clostridium sp. CM028]UVE42330.1 DUF1538 domain-containing protein [Clostridium sp. CM027]WAG71347.1 DUF1538 domain-containing protein [Clostridium sp. CF011]